MGYGGVEHDGAITSGLLELARSESMKIHVNRIPAEGLHGETTYDPKILDMDRFDVQLKNPIAVSSFITKADQELIVQAEIRCLLRLSCARCLTSFEHPLQTETTLSYQVASTEVVDITEDIRQEIILAYPMIPVCQSGCKGLCSMCGQNLNSSPCPHQTTMMR